MIDCLIFLWYHGFVLENKKSQVVFELLEKVFLIDAVMLGMLINRSK